MSTAFIKPSFLSTLICDVIVTVYSVMPCHPVGLLVLLPLCSEISSKRTFPGFFPHSLVTSQPRVWGEVLIGGTEDCKCFSSLSASGDILSRHYSSLYSWDRCPVLLPGFPPGPSPDLYELHPLLACPSSLGVPPLQLCCSSLGDFSVPFITSVTQCPC